MWAEQVLLIPIQLLQQQTFKYSLLQVLVVLGLDPHGLLRFTSKLSVQAVGAVVQEVRLAPTLMLAAEEEEAQCPVVFTMPNLSQHH